MKAKYYYESHITVDAELPEYWKEFTSIGGDEFKHSKFDVDDVDSYHGKWFMSSRGTVLGEVVQSVRDTVKELTDNGYNVIRWKIEDTLFDSKYGDTFD